MQAGAKQRLPGGKTGVRKAPYPADMPPGCFGRHYAENGICRTAAEAGKMNQIRKIGGREETRRFLESLGFVVGGYVTVISVINGNLIVNVKESRVAIDGELADKIMV